MKKKTGRPPVKNANRASILIPVRVSPKEYTAFKKYMRSTGEQYMTRTLRALIQQAIMNMNSIGG